MHFNLQNKSLILLVALAVAAVSAWLTVNGMVALYKGTINTIIILMIILEVSKITIAGWLIVGRKTKLKIPLIIFMLGLMGLSLFGHFGFLTESYAQQRAGETITSGEAGRLDKKILRYEQELSGIQLMLDQMPTNFVTKRQQLYQATAPRRQELNATIDSLYAIRDTLLRKEVKVDLQIGPFSHLSELFHIDQDTIARLISIWLALIIDPLAIILIMAGVQKDSTLPTAKPRFRHPSAHLAPLDPWPSVPWEPEVQQLDEQNTDSNKKNDIGKEEEESIVDPPQIPSTSVYISGKYQDSVFKLAAIMRLANVELYLSDANTPLEDLVAYIPSVKAIHLGKPEHGPFLELGNNPNYSYGWLVDYYTTYVGAPSFSLTEWQGLLERALTHSKAPTPSRHSVYINLSDADAEYELQSLLTEKIPTLNCYYETLRRSRPDGLLDMARRASACSRRVITLGPLSATMELLGLDYLPFQGHLSDKVIQAYKMPGTVLLRNTPEAIIHALS